MSQPTTHSNELFEYSLLECDALDICILSFRKKNCFFHLQDRYPKKYRDVYQSAIAGNIRMT
jgi:hypothetical protein